MASVPKEAPMAEPTSVNPQITDLAAENTAVNSQITDLAKDSGPQEMPGRAILEAEKKPEDKG
jgi:hypothetical protein